MALHCYMESNVLKYNLGAVLSYRTPEGVERPIAYASWSLSEAEKKYTQIKKEALSLVWGVKKFPAYLEGGHFTLVTDHQPLRYIMDPGKAVPVTVAARIQRWCLFLVLFHTASNSVTSNMPIVMVDLAYPNHRHPLTSPMKCKCSIQL